MFVPISSTNTSRSVSTFSVTITFQAALKNSSRSSAPILRFLGEDHPLHQSPHGRVAEGRGGYVLQEAAPLKDGRDRALLYVLLEQDPGLDFADLVGTTGALPGLERPSFSGGPPIALDGGEAHVEETSGLGFGHTRSMAATIFLRRSSE